jgi:putative acetyltransferase
VPDDPITVRDEHPADSAAVRRVNVAAFERDAEADLVDALRRQARPLVSLVAEHAGEVVGHILFTPVTLAGQPQLRIMGLAPLAVLPALQRQGVGSALTRAGLARCAEQGADAVVVLGHPDYYPRFGFAPAAARGLRCEYDVPDDAFMVMELRAGALRGAHGTLAYHPAFASV